MNASNIMMKMIVCVVTGIILYFLSPKLNLKSLKWITETSKRRRITFVISIILGGVICFIIDNIDLEFINVFSLVPISIVGTINHKVSEIDMLKK